MLLEPLGRICDLLDSSPEIEPGADPAWIDARTGAELEAVRPTIANLDAEAGRAEG